MGKPDRLCPSRLSAIRGSGYSPQGVRDLWGGVRVAAELPFDRTEFQAFRGEHSDRMSISGVQEKISLKLDGRRLAPTTRDGEFLLKPVPRTMAAMLELPEDVPANEHVTMQIAAQVFGIRTAPCGLVFFPDGEPALIVRRFDRHPETGRKLLQEDFCQLSGRSRQTGGRNYKYSGSYEEIGELLRRFCPAWRVEMRRLFEQIVFCYVFANGDAHLKNFSLLESTMGDHLLSPAYDVLSTTVHFPDESRMALDLLAGDYETASFTRNGFLKLPDFVELARRFALPDGFARKVLANFGARQDRAMELVDRSLMSSAARVRYKELVKDRLLAIRD